MPAPFEIIAAPFTAWLAAVGSAYPNVGVAPGAAWTKLGSSGDRNVNEDGVTVAHPQKLELVRVAGATGPVKAFRTEEDIKVSFSLLDMRLEMMKYILNGNAVADTAAVAGVPGYRTLALLRGLDVTQYALLLRGPSAYADSMYLDYRIPRVVHVGEPEIVAKKGDPMGLLFEFQAIEDPDYANGKFGEILMQDAAAL